MKKIDGGSITSVPGIKASGITAGLKQSGKKDMCIISSEGNPVAAAVFTQNVVKAAPVLLNIENIKSPTTKAVVVNSGNANSCTGEVGKVNALKMTELVANELGIDKKEVIVQSTGIIGKQLDMPIIESGIKKGVEALSSDGGNDAAVAIKTTDTCEKEVAVSLLINDKKVTVAGMAKGSGMIHPNMATMLSFVVTDLNISKNMLELVFKEIADETFNMISVDGDTSTNDMAMVLANGLAENDYIFENCSELQAFKGALMYVNKELAKLIAQDGEGATKLIEVEVKNAKTLEDARKCAKAVVTSDLTKCAFFGADANWGRIFCAIGYSGGNFDPDKVDIAFIDGDGHIMVAESGMPVSFDEVAAKELLMKEQVKVGVDLKDGNYSATAWGCDLTYEYVKINGEYRT